MKGYGGFTSRTLWRLCCLILQVQSRFEIPEVIDFAPYMDDEAEGGTGQTVKETAEEEDVDMEGEEGKPSTADTTAAAAEGENGETFHAKTLIEQAKAAPGTRYVLHSVLVHSGSIFSGHYYAFVRPQLAKTWAPRGDEISSEAGSGSKGEAEEGAKHESISELIGRVPLEEDEEGTTEEPFDLCPDESVPDLRLSKRGKQAADWMRFDDCDVSFATKQQAVDANFGGTGSSHYSFAGSSAYMLVYVKESALPYIKAASEAVFEDAQAAPATSQGHHSSADERSGVVEAKERSSAAPAAADVDGGNTTETSVAGSSEGAQDGGDGVEKHPEDKSLALIRQLEEPNLPAEVPLAGPNEPQALADDDDLIMDFLLEKAYVDARVALPPSLLAARRQRAYEVLSHYQQNNSGEGKDTLLVLDSWLSTSNAFTTLSLHGSPEDFFATMFDPTQFPIIRLPSSISVSDAYVEIAATAAMGMFRPPNAVVEAQQIDKFTFPLKFRLWAVANTPQTNKDFFSSLRFLAPSKLRYIASFITVLTVFSLPSLAVYDDAATGDASLENDLHSLRQLNQQVLFVEGLRPSSPVAFPPAIQRQINAKVMQQSPLLQQTLLALLSIATAKPNFQYIFPANGSENAGNLAHLLQCLANSSAIQLPSTTSTAAPHASPPRLPSTAEAASWTDEQCHAYLAEAIKALHEQSAMTGTLSAEDVDAILLGIVQGVQPASGGEGMYNKEEKALKGTIASILQRWKEEMAATAGEGNKEEGSAGDEDGVSGLAEGIEGCPVLLWQYDEE